MDIHYELRLYRRSKSIEYAKFGEENVFICLLVYLFLLY